ncbi:uncharacterized protein LOC9644457 isoform X2 [Selaginella moellendorffii]|uniref:uncharacterized protein LOC9644457 isoform X2 n=1 Tax=Selaginella moellendorffii TaxID=88036 RepID=UPI000D1C3934|nr:uncharacterized protein LOC9644457 isoform X2 [Selaginella moellendorffii]|eukprot:XP_024521385.1 uncharacterized protein LOC9644457 isoform X2 [Selaginella moellendorffii]
MQALIGAAARAEEAGHGGRLRWNPVPQPRALPAANAVLCLVEQEEDGGNDRGCALLHVFNAVASTSRQEDGELLFPPNARVAIKEPLCFSSALQVSSPASVEFLGLARAASAKPLGRLLKEANALLSRGSYVLAELYYTELLDMRAKSGAPTYGVLEKQVFSRRAEARLRLRRYEEAFVDAETATKIPGASDSHHARSLWCKGKSLTALQEHELALPCFRSAVALPDAPPDVSIDLERSRTYLRESRDGEYDITDFVLGRKVEPECSDYFGPLELRMTPDGRGRGVYLTRDVRRGELLIVCNPTAYVKTPRIENADRDLYVELIRSCSTSSRPRYHIYAMADASKMTTVPDLDRFKCNIGRVVVPPGSKVEEVDIERVRRVGHRCGFTTQAGDAWIAGVWASSGFFNHSCTPNASKVCFGRVMFIRAARNMSAGDEVLLSYLEATGSMEPLLLAPLPAREVKCKRLDFECSCKRCVLERTNKDLVASFKFYDRRRGDAQKTLDEVLDLEKRMTARGFSDEEKDCIRAAQVERYSAVCVLKHPELPSAGDYLRILHETAPGNFETLSKMGVLYRAAGCGDESLQLLHEEVAALFGELRREIVDGVINQVIAQATLLDEMR